MLVEIGATAAPLAAWGVISSCVYIFSAVAAFVVKVKGQSKTS